MQKGEVYESERTIRRKQRDCKQVPQRIPFTSVGEKGLRLDDYYLFHELLKNYKASQGKEKQEQLERLMGGECFKGRKALLGELRVVLSDFR